MLTMRLQRIGKKGQAYFRLIVTEHTKKPQGEFHELLGSYDPHKKNLLVKKDRIEYWLSKGVQPSPTLNNLLVNNKIITAPKMVSWKPKVKEQAAVPTVVPQAAASEGGEPRSSEAAPETSEPAVEEKPKE